MKKLLSIVVTLVVSVLTSVNVWSNSPDNPDAGWAISITAADFADESESAIWLEGGGNFHYAWNHKTPEMNVFKAGDTIQVLIDGYVQAEVDSVSVTLGRMSIGPAINGVAPTWGWSEQKYQYYGKDANAFAAPLTSTDFTDGQLILKLPIPADVKPTTEYYSRAATESDSLVHWMLQLTGTSTTHDSYMNFVVDFEAGAASIRQLESVEMNVYPNPVKAGEKVYLDASVFANEVSLSVYNLSGQRVANKLTNASSTVSLDANFAPGIYTVDMTDGNKRAFQKLIIK